MDFTDFSLRISKIKNLDLPGTAAHHLMVPADRAGLLAEGGDPDPNAREAAVMLLFYADRAGRTRIPLILRPSYDGVHADQVGLPGGKRETADPDLLATALRETREEIGVALPMSDVLTDLSNVYIPPSRFRVTPYLGLVREPVDFVLQESEVAQLIEADLEDLLDDAKIIFRDIPTAYGMSRKVPAFDLNGYVVWGATAMILSEARALILQLV